MCVIHCLVTLILLSIQQTHPLVVIHSNDYLPRHVHGFLDGTEVIVDLRTDGNVALAARKDAIRPANAKRANVRKILNVAAQHFEALANLWEKIQGNA